MKFLVVLGLLIGLNGCAGSPSPAPPVVAQPVAPPPVAPKTVSELKLEKLQQESDRACGFLKQAMELPPAERSGVNMNN